MRIEPPMSVPSSKLLMPVATAAAAPPDEPPGTRLVSHGLLVVPNSALNVWTSPDHSGTFVRPSDHHAGVAQPADRGRVLGGDVVGELQRATGRAPTGHLVGVLQRDRHAVQRAELVAAGHRGVGGVGRRPGPVGVQGDHGVDRRVDRLDAGELLVEELAARQLALRRWRRPAGAWTTASDRPWTPRSFSRPPFWTTLKSDLFGQDLRSAPPPPAPPPPRAAVQVRQRGQRRRPRRGNRAVGRSTPARMCG